MGGRKKENQFGRDEFAICIKALEHQEPGMEVAVASNEPPPPPRLGSLKCAVK